MARKTLYNADNFPLFAEGYARNGLNDIQIAEKLGVSLATYYNYQIKYVEFLEAIKRGKKPVDTEVENSLLKRALGYDYEEKSTEVEIGKDGKPTPTKIKTTKKHIPGDVGAMAFWLKNRKSSDWRDKRELGLTDKEGEDLFKMTKEQLLERRKQLSKILDKRN